MTNLFDLSAHRFEIKSCMAANVSISVQGDFYYEEGFLLFQIILAQNVKKNCPSLTPDALERAQLFASLRFWTFRVIQSRFMSN